MDRAICANNFFRYQTAQAGRQSVPVPSSLRQTRLCLPVRCSIGPRLKGLRVPIRWQRFYCTGALEGRYIPIPTAYHADNSRIVVPPREDRTAGVSACYIRGFAFEFLAIIGVLIIVENRDASLPGRAVGLRLQHPEIRLPSTRSSFPITRVSVVAKIPERVAKPVVQLADYPVIAGRRLAEIAGVVSKHVRDIRFEAAPRSDCPSK